MKSARRLKGQEGTESERRSDASDPYEIAANNAADTHAFGNRAGLCSLFSPGRKLVFQRRFMYTVPAVFCNFSELNLSGPDEMKYSSGGGAGWDV